MEVLSWLLLTFRLRFLFISIFRRSVRDDDRRPGNSRNIFRKGQLLKIRKSGNEMICISFFTWPKEIQKLKYLNFFFHSPNEKVVQFRQYRLQILQKNGGLSLHGYRGTHKELNGFINRPYRFTQMVHRIHVWN